MKRPRRPKCRKRGYPDRLGALIALASTQRSQDPRREERRAYECPACGMWHLTKLGA